VLRNKFPSALSMVVIYVAMAFVLVINVSASTTEKLLHTFQTEGCHPFGLIMDTTGNLYGTAGGGAFNAGAVFELSPASGGGWSYNQLYTFTGGADGGNPAGGGLVLDSAGNLYGTTSSGGTYSDGTVFELSPASGGGWTESVLYSFQGGTDGGSPSGVPIFDKAGNLYGTASNYGAYGAGTVFELSPGVGGTWTYSVLWAFAGGANGGLPSGVVLDSKGNLFGETFAGGVQDSGTVFKLTLGSQGKWKESVIYSHKGFFPNGVLHPPAFKAGNLYGTTDGGGNGTGTVFQLSLGSGGHWTERILYSFKLGSQMQPIPSPGLTFDAGGNLYVETPWNGDYTYGAVNKLHRGSGGGWSRTIFYSLQGPPTDGNGPNGGVVFDSSGNLYGTTFSGGSGCGVVYEITPQ
jgi:uncharacterized repeat protein (TIGR03803 family)